MTEFIIKAFSVFGAGILASFSPCVYPMIPVTVGYFGTQKSTARSLKIISFILGQIITFTSLALIAVKTGQSIGFTSQSVVINLVLGSLLLVFGFYSWKGTLPAFLTKWNNTKALNARQNNGVFGALLLGIASALLASPCTTPVLGGILGLLAESDTILQGASLMFFYSIGFSLLLLGIALGILNTNKLPKAGNWLSIMHKLSSILLVGLGFFYLYKAFVNI